MPNYSGICAELFSRCRCAVHSYGRRWRGHGGRIFGAVGRAQGVPDSSGATGAPGCLPLWNPAGRDGRDGNGCLRGLPLLDGALDPMHTTTYGVGEMLLHAERNGIRRVLLGIGGSATVDCGLGMAAALGYRFLDKNGAQVEAVTCHMADIASIIVPDRKPKLDIIAACDVDNPLCGETGAIYTFGKQKGISEEMMPQMDAQMKRFARIIAKQTGVNVLDVPGAGAAGGMGAALLAFLNAKLKPGVELLLDAVGFDSLLKETDIVFTGEGRIDWQSTRGKVPVGVARRAQAAACRALRCAVPSVRAPSRYMTVA